ncbi:MAG: methyl-accepting chemotaxis protein [Acidobacteriota bacterium]
MASVLVSAGLEGVAWSLAGGPATFLGWAAGAIAVAGVMLTLRRRDRQRRVRVADDAARRVARDEKDVNYCLRRVRDSIAKLHTVLSEEASSLARGGQDAASQTNLLDEAATEMSAWIRNVGDSIEHLSTSTEETSSSVFEMVATIEEIAHHIGGVATAVNETAGSTTSLVTTIQGIDANVERLRKFVSETSGTMEQVTGAIRQVESRTADSDQHSKRVAANAEEGKAAVESTIEGMVRIRSAVSGAGEAINDLGRRSEEIGGILSVIDDVAEQTNLLALNAAIIAAQAGEHGKGFAVVADEIRGLAERTASSTREIGALIGFFQEETTRARQGIEDGSRHVEDGVALAERAGEALAKILASARESSRMAAEISQTTQEQVQGTHIVVEAVGRVEDMVAQLSAITAEQTAQSDSITTTVERMRELTEQVRRATVEQAKGGGLITEAIRSVTDNVATIHQATMQQDTESDRIADALGSLRASSHEGETCARRVADASVHLREILQEIDSHVGPASAPRR